MPLQKSKSMTSNQNMSLPRIHKIFSTILKLIRSLPRQKLPKQPNPNGRNFMNP